MGKGTSFGPSPNTAVPTYVPENWPPTVDVTVTLAVKFEFRSLAEITAVPCVMPVTLAVAPLGVTVATAGEPLLHDQRAGSTDTTFPFASSASAVTVTCWPTDTLTGFGVMRTL